MKKKLLIGFGIVVVVLAIAVASFAYIIVHRSQGHYLDVDGVKLFYTDEGSGEPVVLVHGVAANADLNWRRPGVVRKLARHFRVITFDMRGHGLSDKPKDPSLYGSHLVDDIGRVMDHLKIERAHIAGYSLGGFIALKFITTYPNRVQSAAICAAGWADPSAPFDIPNPYRRPKRTALLESLPGAEANWATAGVLPTPWDVVNGVRNWVSDQIVDRAAIRALKKTYMQLGVPLTAIKSNRVPTICLIGTYDGLLPFAEAMRQHMANLEYVSLPGANHLWTPFYSQFKEELLTFFLKHHDSEKPAA